MARTRDTVDASLELLLDTITNTFGSVLFITMLVAVLLRVSGKLGEATSPPDRMSQAKVEATVAELSAEIDRLTKTLGSLPVVDPVAARIEADMLATTQDVARLMAEATEAAAELMRDQEMIARIEGEIERTARELETLEPEAKEQLRRRKQAESVAAELAKTAVELDRPIDPIRIVQTASMPELSSTEKEQFGLLMRYGRLYVMHERGPAGERQAPNSRHFVVTTRPDGLQSARARPEAGHIADAATIKDALRGILSAYPADKWVVAIVVHEDSFAQFQSVKAALVSLGYQYEPMTARAGTGVWDSGGQTKRGQ